MIPTREQIYNKIIEIKADPAFSTIKSDLKAKLAAWLDSLDMPETIIVGGEEVNPKRQILEDLDSYDNY